jgi:hypothetical protein
MTTVSGGASALQHTNRRGVAFHLHQGTTKTGKPKYCVAKTVGPGALAEMPLASSSRRASTALCPFAA